MAASNHTPPAFSIGVNIDCAGRITMFGEGSFDVRIAEAIAGKLVSLAHAVREEARSAVLES